ncbi:MAG: hypothetical protein B5M46_00935 [Epsilonproteobacteria bacterium 4484_20]|nr:MAG: hypothetical protein B5M46_00935 [Epsilonproteobacteria bacterium 4484_20]
MKNIQIILNAILSQDVFEYILIDKDHRITNFSEGVEKYIAEAIQAGDDIRDHLPEMVGYEEKVRSVFENKNNKYILETVQKNDYYINIHVEHYSHDIALILLHNTTEITLSKLELLQYSNENMLLYSTIKKILDSQNNLLVVTSNNRIEYANRKFLEYFGLESVDEIKERDAHNFGLTSLPIKDFDELYEYTKDEEKQLTIGEDAFLVKATMLERTYKLFTFSNITQLSNTNQLLEHKINIDPLTGAYKKPYFDEKLREELKKGTPFSLVVMDLDNFKDINDHYGHIVGDTILQEFTQLIKSNLRKDDLFSRWGGEEFLVLIKCKERDKIIQKIEKLREMLEKHSFETIGHITASFGITISRDGDSFEELLKRADDALYLAKKSGKNRVVAN